jgi:hypothetical protein
MKISKPTRGIFIGVLLAMVIGPLLVRAIVETLHGRGAEQYQNVYGLGIAWSSLLILVAVFVCTFLIALIARVLYFWKLKKGL